jgi:hypothetical protein
MKKVGIKQIEIDATGRLLVFPELVDPGYYQYVYRAAAEVYWDDAGFFFSPVPREWSYCQWMEQIRFAVRDELGIDLIASNATKFVAASESDLKAMRAALAACVA